MEIFVNNINDSLKPVGVSDLGTLIYDNIVFPANVTLGYEEVKLDAVVFTVNRTKEIVRSTVSGRNGSIREYITNNDYVVSLSAIIASAAISATDLGQIALGFLPGVSGVSALTGLSGYSEPVEFLNNIKRLEQVQDRVQIRNKILQNIFGINYVVITSFNLERIGSDAWGVKMELEADELIDLKSFG